MFSFDYLSWQTHHFGSGGAKQALHPFSNGYTLSVIFGPHCCGDGEDTFEAAIIVSMDEGTLLDLQPYGWNDTVAAWAGREEIEALADTVAQLPPRHLQQEASP